MSVVYAVTPQLRARLKEPFGVLLRGTFAETKDKFSALEKESKPPKIVTVGDAVTRNFHNCGIASQLSVTDNKLMRKRARPANFPVDKVVRVKNPRGTITAEAVTAIREALEVSEKVHVIVEGEEDLLTLIAVLYAPEKSFVVYGQPYEGMVVVEVTAEKKTEVSKILETMRVRKPK